MASVARNKWGLSYKARRATYVAVTQQIITYGCKVWGYRVSNAHIKRKLLLIQRLAAIYVARAYRTALTDGLLAIANLMPVDLLIAERYISYNMRKLDEKKITKEDCDKKVAPFVVGDVIPNLSTLIMEKGLDITTPLNLHPATNKNYEISLDNYNQTSNSINIYTDGSHTDDGTKGAIVIHTTTGKTTYQKYFRLANYSSKNQAESLAIWKAIECVTNNSGKLKGSEIIINTDSRVALHQISKGNTKLPIIKNILCVLDTLRTPIILKWIRGHSGIKGNEQADLLARKAITNLKDSTYDKIPLSWVRKNLHTYFIGRWQFQWNNSNTGRTVHRFLPSITDRKKYHHFIPNYELTQLITGHGNLRSYLARFLNKGDGLCPCPLASWEDSEHILCYCQLYNKERKTIISAALEENIAWPCTFDCLISNKKLYEALIKFIKNIKIFN
ncbi:uncharacterized protein LOC111614246 [Centruroides sculpturatus]|uniref:uncharacterized protein LOC111614246 n=1 Tax=Centruroides sculpturatus TaxID=218467 RepID=UPI000C6D7B3F|nr:uncharacterized protein LOC111614246 [Centruroides sculpturatus]